MKRVAALLGAALLIAIAVFVRDRIDADDDASGDTSADGSTATLVCVSELEDVCRTLDRRDDLVVRIEDASVTEQRLASSALDASQPDFDAWLTIQPFPEMVGEERARALLPPILGDPSEPLARSPLVIVAWNDRLAALETACGGALTWRCIGDAAGRPWPDVTGQAAWGSVKPSHSRPDTTGAGLLVLSQATASYFGRTDFARNDFDTDPAFQRWFEQLERSIPSYPQSPRTPLDEMLSIGPSVFDLTGDLEAEAGPSTARSRDNARLTILYPSPATVADVVAVPAANSRQGARVIRLLESDEVAELLAQSGWRVDGQDLAVGVDPAVELPPGTGLPRAGVLEALRTLWTGTVR